MASVAVVVAAVGLCCVSVWWLSSWRSASPSLCPPRPCPLVCLWLHCARLQKARICCLPAVAMADESKVGSGGGDAVTNQPIVLDNGTGVMKAGFAGDERPKCTFRSYVGRPKYDCVMTGGALKQGAAYVGKPAEDHRGAMRLSFPVEHGAVANWDDMERLWRHVYGEQGLSVASEARPVLLTEPPLNAARMRERTAEVFFETFNAPAIQFSPQPVLSLYASGLVTGVVLGSGEGVTTAVPVYEGFAVKHAIQRSEVAGREVSQRMQLLLRKAGCVFHTSAESEIVRQVKESVGYVSFNPAEEEKNFNNRAKHVTHTLPDGTEIIVGAERFRAPEILFQPSLVGTECVVATLLLRA